MIKRIRIAFLISKTGEIPAWEMDIIKRIQDSENAIILTFIAFEHHKERKEKVGLRIFKMFENWWFRSMPDAFRKLYLNKEFAPVEIFDSSDKKKLTELDLDVIYCSSLVSYDKEFALYAKYGLWYIKFGSDKYVGSEPIGFWEVMNDASEIGSTLNVRRSQNTETITVYKGTTTTVPYSVKNTLNNIAWKSSSFLIHRITEIAELGPDLFFSKYSGLSSDIQSLMPKNSFKPPRNFNILGLFIRNAFRYLYNKVVGVFVKERFTILFSRQEFKISGTDLTNFTPFKLSRDSFWADPFLIETGGRYYIFFEEYLYKKDKAHISALELKNDGSYSDPVIILDKPYHLSYPFVFYLEGSYYMIPDSNSNKTVELYKCSEFPFKWEFVENLMENISLIDSTLFYYQNKWWLFGSNTNNSVTSTNDQLFLYYSETLFSPNWKPHPQNPVATLISNCRPAGKIFQQNNKLYRPAQNNSSKQYGYAIKINEIEILNETEYREREVYEILPNRKNKLSAVHTINFENNLIVIDGII